MPRRPRRASSARGEAGGAVSLWVLLMVPISAFAAVAAMAGPQRLAAEFSTQEASDDLATFAVAWRDLHDKDKGPLPALPLQCPTLTPAQKSQLNTWNTELDTLKTTSIPILPQPPSQSDLQPIYDKITTIRSEVKLRNNGLNNGDLELRLPGDPLPPIDPPSSDPQNDGVVNDYEAQVESLTRSIEELEDQILVCEAMHTALVGDLGNLGMDMNSLRGAYSDSLSTAPGPRDVPPEDKCSIPGHNTEAACTDPNVGGTWIEFPRPVLCRTQQQDVVVRDAVYVVLASRWQDAGWAAAQVWPDGLPMAAESVGRLNQRTIPTNLPPCDEYLAVLDSEGRPVWAGDPQHDSRELVQSVPRTTLAG